MDFEQEKSAAGAAGQPMATTALEKLSVECPTHGRVPVVCPRCAGKAGGRAHRGTRSKRTKALEDLERAREFCEIAPEMDVLARLVEENKKFRAICDKLGASAQERAEMREDMIRWSLFRELAERAGWTQEERLQVLPLLDRHCQSARI
jgi:hypothetical protein